MALCCCRCCNDSRSRVRVRAVPAATSIASSCSRLRSHGDAEELTQQTFADAAAALARGAPPRSMRPWLFSVAERRLVDELRRRGARAEVARALVRRDAPARAGASPARSERLSPAAASQRRLSSCASSRNGRTARSRASSAATRRRARCGSRACRATASRRARTLRDESVTSRRRGCVRPRPRDSSRQ